MGTTAHAPANKNNQLVNAWLGAWDWTEPGAPMLRWWPGRRQHNVSTVTVHGFHASGPLDKQVFSGLRHSAGFWLCSQGTWVLLRSISDRVLLFPF
jgi:hypothetical protein